MKKSKWFAIATEGATTDGRNISRQWIEQMASNYNAKTYGARVNLEHIRGLVPDSPFRSYGDILALKTEEEDGKLKLLAQISPTDDLVALNKQRQKVYSSMEVDLDFAGTGEAYLVGLAVTDSPASLGTEMLQFSSQAEASPLAARKQKPENLFSAATPVELAFEDVETTNEPGLLEKVKALFTKHKAESGAELSAFTGELESTLELLVGKITALQTTTEGSVSSDQFNALQESHTALQGELTKLREQLEKTPSTDFRRSPATGSDNTQQTDC